MFELTNEQRKCFALEPVDEKWERIVAKPSPYDKHVTYLYLDGNTIVKWVMTGEDYYREREMSDEVSDDRKYLLPKTAKGKPVLLSSSNVEKRKGKGICLNYYKEHIVLYNENIDCDYFNCAYEDVNVCDTASFVRWVENWCAETTEADYEDIARFARQEKRHVKFREGDVFRYKIGRRLYGYGRILLDYEIMRKRKEPFWDVLMMKPLVCSAYHIVTDRADVGVDELKSLRSLPSSFVADNCFYYGEYEIIGNLPIAENEDYPIMYGGTISRIENNVVYYQCGKVYRRLENANALYNEFGNNGVSFLLNVRLDILLECIEKQSNEPYWTKMGKRDLCDLRNPAHYDKLCEVKKQFGLD